MRWPETRSVLCCVCVCVFYICIQSNGRRKMSFRWLKFFLRFSSRPPRFPFSPAGRLRPPRETNEQLNVLGGIYKVRMREEDMTTPGRDNASSSSQSFDDFDRKYGSRTHADSYTTKRERLQSEEEINKMGNRTALSTRTCTHMRITSSGKVRKVVGGGLPAATIIELHHR